MKAFKLYVLDRLSEASTWRSLMFFATLLTGYQLDWPEEHQLFLATTVAYAIGLLAKDKTK